MSVKAEQAAGEAGQGQDADHGLRRASAGRRSPRPRRRALRAASFGSAIRAAATPQAAAAASTTKAASPERRLPPGRDASREGIDAHDRPYDAAPSSSAPNQKRPIGSTPARPPVSVVVPFAGDAAAARMDAVASWSSLETAPGDELIVADNTRRERDRGGRRPGSEVVRADRERSSYHARNVGAAAATNDWLLFIDADCLPAPRLLDLYFEAEIGARVGILAGGVRPAPGQTALSARYARARTHTTEEPQVRSPFRAGGDHRATCCCGGQRLRGGRRFPRGPALRRRRRDLLADPGRGLDPRPPAAGVGRASPRRDHGGDGASMSPPRRRPGVAEPALPGRRPAATADTPAPARARRLRLPSRPAAGRAGAVPGDRRPLVLLRQRRLPARQPGRPRSEPSTILGGPSKTPTVFLCDAFPALSETFVSSEARALAELGHPIRVESAARPERPDPVARRRDRQHPARGRRDRRQAAGADRALRPSSAALPRRPGRAPALGREEERVWPLRSLAPVARRIGAGGERHIHAHFAEDAALNALRLGRLLGLPFSVTAHAYDIFKDPRNLPEKLREAAFATSGCDYNVDYLQRLLDATRAARVHKVVMGVDGERFRRRRRAPGGPPRRRGRPAGGEEGVRSPDRGGGAARPARRRWSGSRSSARARFARDLERLVAERGLDRRCQLLGWRTGEGVRGLLEEADLLAMPSVVAADGESGLDAGGRQGGAGDGGAGRRQRRGRAAGGRSARSGADWLLPGDPEALAAAIEEHARQAGRGAAADGSRRAASSCSSHADRGDGDGEAFAADRGVGELIRRRRLFQWARARRQRDRARAQHRRDDRRHSTRSPGSRSRRNSR